MVLKILTIRYCGCRMLDYHNKKIATIYLYRFQSCVCYIYRPGQWFLGVMVEHKGLVNLALAQIQSFIKT